MESDTHTAIRGENYARVAPVNSLPFSVANTFVMVFAAHVWCVPVGLALHAYMCESPNPFIVDKIDIHS